MILGGGGRGGAHPGAKNLCRLPVVRTRLKTEVPLSDVVVMDFALHDNETLKCLPSLPILMQYHSGGDSVVLGIAPASPTSWDLGPRLHIRFGVGGMLNSKKKKEILDCFFNLLILCPWLNLICNFPLHFFNISRGGVGRERERD